MAKEIQFEDYPSAKAYGLRMRAQGYKARVKPRGGQWMVILREKKGGPELPGGGVAGAMEEEYQAPRMPAPRRMPTPRTPPSGKWDLSSAPALKGMDLSHLRGKKVSLDYLRGPGQGRAPKLGGNAESVGEAGRELMWQPGGRKLRGRIGRRELTLEKEVEPMMEGAQDE